MPPILITLVADGHLEAIFPYGVMTVVWKLDHLARSLIRHGNHLRTLVDQFNIKPVEIKAFSTGTLNAERTRELTEIMKEAGVPA